MNFVLLVIVLGSLVAYFIFVEARRNGEDLAEAEREQYEAARHEACQAFDRGRRKMNVAMGQSWRNIEGA